MIRAAILGLGHHGKRFIEILKQIKEVELLALVDSDSNKKDLYTELKFYTSSNQLYENQTIDFVIIATNGSSHASLALEAIKNGVKYILIEKPMACSVAECIEIEEHAKKANVRISINQQNRFHPAIRYIQEKISGNHWGRVRTIFMQIPGIGLGCLSSHWIDISNFLLGSNPLKVTGWIDSPKYENPRGPQFVDPGGLVIMDYGNETRAIISQIEDGAGPISIEIHTTSVRIIFDPKNNVLNILEREFTAPNVPKKPPTYIAHELPNDLNVMGNMQSQIVSLIEELLYAETITSNENTGKKVIEIIASAYISAEQGNTPVVLPLTDTKHIELFLPIT